MKIVQILIESTVCKLNSEVLVYLKGYVIKLFHLIEVSTSFEGAFVDFHLCISMDISKYN
jgi:hypothetical protein